MTERHDVQALSDLDVHVYEAVAAQSVESGGGSAGLDGVVRASGLTEEEVRASLGKLVEQGYVVPFGGGYGLGPHTFEVEY
ncbi:unnamed protein product [[Actinomadura] parvosata subsp. kistnae]|uniref:Uncharacterized protein n=2 Tax=Nonomuraea TaxID=83681 RepID=A0A1V0A4H0_9ACTN|nr:MULTISPECIES: hypothetical protein [unclassified Nonomuraea]AQZ65088.1 hypothetical protein BKM31_29835 [Nonomuraea sp. ATCC 55076]NJP90894.1 hypothetical protein [Nonomuraea sp. FMUSA5-5]SPL96358.1 unnamed protein product [Actinomadura parvosata subsp. kistnae]